MARKNLYINDTNIGTYGIYISSDTILNSPQIDYKEYSVPGRTGNIIQYNNRLDNVVRKFTCHIPLKTNVASGLASLKKLLYSNIGYVKISSDYEPNVYQYGYLAQPLDVKPFNVYRTATFDLYFSCRPQKYSTTSASVNIPITFSDTNLWRVFSRSDPFMQTLFDQIDPSLIPSNDFFYVVGNNNYSFATSDTITSINASWSGGDTFIALVTGMHNSKPTDTNVHVRFVTNQSISNESFTVSSADWDNFFMITPVQMSGYYTFTFNHNGNANDESTGNLADQTATITELSAMGLKPILEITYGYYQQLSPTTYDGGNAIILKGFCGNQEKTECAVEWRENLMSQFMCDQVMQYATLVTGFEYTFTVIVDLEKNECYVRKTGMPDLPFNECMMIFGDMNKSIIDTIKGTYINLTSTANEKAKINADWWTL